MNHRRAFSLVELVIVVSIIAIAGAIAIPRYSASIARYRLSAAAARVVADLDRARAAAQVASGTRTVEFKPALVGYAVSDEASLRRRSDAYTVELGQDPYRVSALAADFSGTGILTYNAFGLPNRGGVVTLRLGTLERKIVVNAKTGKADIQ